MGWPILISSSSLEQVLFSSLKTSALGSGDQMARLSAAAGSPESNRALRLARDIVTRGIILCRLLKLETIYGLENNVFN